MSQTNRLLCLFLGLLLFPTGVYGQDKSGFTQLFNGKDLIGWEGNSEYWSVRDGVIVAKSTKNIAQNGLLWSSLEVKDFYLALDVRLTPHDRHGGIQFRSKPDKGLSRATGYQADMGQVAEHGNLWGRLYDEGGRGKLDWNTHGANVVKPGEWNRFRIIAQGDRIRSFVNGTLVADYRDNRDASGFIGLQVHAIKNGTGPYSVAWKNIRIRELDKDGKID